MTVCLEHLPSFNTTTSKQGLDWLYMPFVFLKEIDMDKAMLPVFLLGLALILFVILPLASV
jgi:hypothetical protein